ncbi:MAG: divalent-cation tolerance protein CutA [Bacteroidota bacterium]
MSFTILYITHPDEQTAKKITSHLLEKKLVACGNIFPITSAFWWKNEIQHEAEWVSIVKTATELGQVVQAEVEKIHSYEVPCIMRFEVSANEAYERWIRESVELGFSG